MYVYNIYTHMHIYLCIYIYYIYTCRTFSTRGSRPSLCSASRALWSSRYPKTRYPKIESGHFRYPEYGFHGIP